jgi:hypothetical protein
MFLVNFKHEVKAATGTFYYNQYSIKYSSAYNPYNYKHIGYFYAESQSGNSRYQIYSDLYMRNYYRVTYAGLLGSPQATYSRTSIMETKFPYEITKMSFFMSQEFIHTNSITLEITVDVNDFKNGFGVTWTNTTRYAEGVKISANVMPNYNNAPLVALAVYKIEIPLIEVKNVGTSTRSWFLGSWSDYSWVRTTSSELWVTVGYVACCTYLGDGNDTDFMNANYLLENSSIFNDTNLYRTY